MAGDDVVSKRKGRGLLAWIADESGPVKAITAVLALVLAASALVIGSIGWLRKQSDSGPSGKDVTILATRLPDRFEFATEDTYLVPFGARLPGGAQGGYCDHESMRGLKATGGAVRINLQNVYQGEKPADIQVVAFSAKVLEYRSPTSAVSIKCAWSGGDAPKNVLIRAEHGAVGRGELAPSDNVYARESDTRLIGPATSFVLSKGEHQQVNLIVLPNSRADAKIQIWVQLLADGKRSTRAVVDPFWVRTDAKRGPTLVEPKGVVRGPELWDCRTGQESLTCADNRAPASPAPPET
jgi:hypothetical protein